jgi:hypothetical protein
MPCCTTTRAALLLPALSLALAAAAQATGDSPYSAYGLGDLVPQGQATQAFMAGTGLAITEPYALRLGNPASYAALARPVFEGGAVYRITQASSGTAKTNRSDANFTGFQLGVPFGKGKWGLGLGLTPYSDVGYTAERPGTVDGGEVDYRYTGSGGVDRVFLGLGRRLYQHATDSLGNTGSRILLGADLAFLFGSIEQTRDAVYPTGQGYLNTRAFSSLVLRAPTANASLVWQGDLTRKARKGDDNWRWSVGASMQLPVSFQARYSDLTTTFTIISGIESVFDTVPGLGERKGNVDLPAAFGLGIGVQNARWAFTAEVHQQDWGQTRENIDGYAFSSTMRQAVSVAGAARFRPSLEGNAFQRAVYRIGFRHDELPQEVRLTGLSANAATLGLSLPLNAAQTNSWFHLGAEFGQRGTTDAGLIRERYAAVWIGITFTPWRGERWFTAPKIQ